METKIFLWFDVEDYATIESDDAFAELLEMLDETGARSTIKFCVKKLELLRERGRRDILDRLPNHEMSFHTTNHSVHPLPTEYLDRFGFAAGAAEFDRKELAGFRSLQDITGQNVTSYGQPGEAWAPQVFPALKKWGITTYLDAHPILGIDGKSFWYGGILCYTDLKNLIRLQHQDGGQEQYIRDFDNIDRSGQEIVFVSTYDHPTEFSCEVFWDEVNFSHGKNPQLLQPAPLRAPGEQTRFIRMLKQFILHTQKQEHVEYITASQGIGLEINRKTPVAEADLKAIAESMGNDVTFVKCGAAYLSAAEVFSLAARHLTGRLPIPELLYGPEEFEESVVIREEVSAKELAEAAYGQFDLALGFKQLKSLYRVGGNFLNPVDVLCTMLEAVRSGKPTVKVQRGTLAAAKYVRDDFKFGGGWVLWADDFKAENIFKHTRLQTWTLKPALF